MDRQQALQLYIQAVMPEREAALYDRALRKVHPITRSMSAEEREAYLNGRAFAVTLYRVKRADRAWQLMQRGELALDVHQAEFDRLAPMIQAEGAADLRFLRSVERSRVSLKRARAALAAIAEQAPRAALESEAKRLESEAAGFADRYLRREDLAWCLGEAGQAEQVVSHLLATKFRKGIPSDVVERAFRPRTLTEEMRSAVRQRCPALRGCGPVATPSGATVSEAVAQEIDRMKQQLCGRLRRRFPRERLAKLLAQNPSVRRLQRQQDAAAAKQRRLKNALVSAVPEHYRDLYPLARQLRRRFILHLGPTNSGKTYEGVGRLESARCGIYLGPLRLLAVEQFETLNLNDVPCSLVTGEEQILVPGSRVQSSTVEMADLKTRYDVAVIDECQMIADRNRGGAWTAAILGLCADEIHLCASPDAEELLTRIIRECGDDLEIVRHRRMTPLAVEKEGFQFPDSVRRGDALIVFSRIRVHAVAAELRRKGWRVALIYGALPPDVRRDQANRFQQGDAEVVVSTDAIAMGMNLPIERVVFLEMEKYDGDIIRPLTDAEIKQIAGRAGRYGQYETGYVNAYGFRGTVSQALARPLPVLTEGIISFPESLLGLPLPLTQTIDRWMSMKDKGCFTKASAVRMRALAAMLETPHTDKSLLYRFLCIPFDETDQDLLTRWRGMYHAECARGHVDVLAEMPQYPDPEGCEIGDLDGLEEDYRRCDLYYNYARLFLGAPEALMEEIQRRKSVISRSIIRILSTRRLRQKTCPECNRVLPWNWPYRLCDACHRRQTGPARGR